MIKTYNPKETKKWMEISSLLAGIIIIIWGIISRQSILLILGFFFILVVSNKIVIVIDEKGLLITITTLFLIKRKDRLNFQELDSIDIREGTEKSLIYFIKGWRGRKVLIDNKNLSKLMEFIKSENPGLIEKK